MNRFKVVLLSLVLAFSFLGAIIPSRPALAANPVCPSGTSGTFCDDATDLNDVIKIIVNTLLFLIGATSVIVIIISGFRMVTSGGNADSVSKARNGILYASIGIVVSLMAYAIVYFVLNRVS